MKERDGISSLFMSLRGGLARAVLGIVPPKEIEDIVQETYVRACQVNNKDAIQEPKAYLFRVARNLALDYVKRAETQLVISDEGLGERGISDGTELADETLGQAVSREEFAEFCEAVRKLPVQRRRAFVLKKVYGFSQREIAAEMQLSEKTVERHIALGMESCMEFFARHGDLTNSVGARKPGRTSGGTTTTRKGGKS